MNTETEKEKNKIKSTETTNHNNAFNEKLYKMHGKKCPLRVRLDKYQSKREREKDKKQREYTHKNEYVQNITKCCKIENFPIIENSYLAQRSDTVNTNNLIVLIC